MLKSDVQAIVENTETELNQLSTDYHLETTLSPQVMERIQLLIQGLKIAHQALYGRFYPKLEQWRALYQTVLINAITMDALDVITFFIEAGCIPPNVMVAGLVQAETLKNKRLKDFFRKKIAEGNYACECIPFFYTAV